MAGTSIKNGKGDERVAVPGLIHNHMGVEVGDIEFYTVLNVDAAPPADSAPDQHKHNYYEIITADSGVINIELPRKEMIAVTPGILCVIPRGALHRTYAVSGDPQKIAIRFSYTRIKSKTGSASGIYKSFDAAMSKIAGPISLEDTIGLAQMAKNICGELANRSAASEIAVKSWYSLLYIGFMRMIGGIDNARSTKIIKSEDSRHFRSNEIEFWLAGHYQYNVTEAVMAKAIGVSNRQLNRIFRDLFNMSFRDKLIEVRMLHAADLLMLTDLKVEEIAYKVGYTTATGFQLAFSKYYGTSPGKYRRENREKN